MTKSRLVFALNISLFFTRPFLRLNRQLHWRLAGG